MLALTIARRLHDLGDSLSLAGSESTHTKRPLNQNLLLHFRNAGNHTPISSFTIMWKDFHLKRYELICDRREHSRVLAACKDFRTLWKDADPDISILKQAKSEYAKLKRLRRRGRAGLGAWICELGAV